MLYKLFLLLALTCIGYASVHMNLRMLVLVPSGELESTSFVNLAFDSVGMPYDVLVVSSTTVLDLVSSTGVGNYAAFVSITNTLLTAAQQLQITSYQLQFGAKWAIVESSPVGLPGVSAGTPIYTRGQLTLASEFLAYSHPLKSTVSVDTMRSIAWAGLEPAALTPAVIIDPSIVVPALMFNGNQVAAAEFKLQDGTRQLHYFIAQNEGYFHSRIFSVVLLNWLAPAGLFVGYRQITLAVQPDDLFLASFLWDIATHSNPLSTALTYRITADDLQSAADFLAEINSILPFGSYITIEWPFNGAGTTWYTQPDPLFTKAKEIQDKFYFVSHTWDHPCTLDTASYDDMNIELVNNINFTPSFLNDGLNSAIFTKDALVNPCITGLFNGEALRAMADNGIKYAVGDNSVPELVPDYLYHGVSNITTTKAVHGHDGIFIIPREAYNIDYDNSLPEELIDQFNIENELNYTFEEIMQLNVDYALEKKTGFRHDAFMFHQANLRFFDYYDPFKNLHRKVSLTTLWMERVLEQTTAIYDLPIVSPKFDNLAKIWIDRESTDNCGFNAELELSGGQLVSLAVSSAQACVVPLTGIKLNGPTAISGQLGPETISFIVMDPNHPQVFPLPSPVPI